MSAEDGRPGARGAMGPRWRPIVVTALLGLFVGFAWGIADEPRYSATASVVLAADAVSGGGDSGQMLDRYAEIAKSNDVATTAAGLLGNDVPGADLLADVTAVPASNGIGLEIQASADMPDFATAAANGYAEALVDVVGRNERGNPLELGAAATLPDHPSKNRSAPGWALGGLAVGLFLALGVAGVRSRLRRQRPRRRAASAEPDEVASKRVPTDRLEATLGTSLLTTIFDPENGLEPGSRGRLVIGEPAISDFRRLADELDLADPDGLRTLALASPSGGEDAFAVAIGISVAAAESGLRVLLVEADLAAPSLSDRLGVDPAPGLGDYLVGATGPRAVLRNVRVEPGTGERISIVCVPAGERGAATPETVGGSRFDGLVQRLPRVYDLVVFLAPPILSDPDAIVVTRAVEGVVVVLGAESDAELRRCADLLRPATLLGAVQTG